jgi:hypothetical protein
VGRRKPELRAKYIGVCTSRDLDQLCLPTWLVTTENEPSTVRCIEGTRKTPAQYMAWLGPQPKGNHKDLRAAVACLLTDRERKLFNG